MVFLLSCEMNGKDKWEMCDKDREFFKRKRDYEKFCFTFTFFFGKDFYNCIQNLLKLAIFYALKS